MSDNAGVGDKSVRTPVLIAIDGVCVSNAGQGGWAAIVQDGTDTRVFDGTDASTTARRMQLTAIVRSLSSLDGPSSVTVHLTSRTLVDDIRHRLPAWALRGWRDASGSGIADADLWKHLERELLRHNIAWTWFAQPVHHRHDAVVSSGPRVPEAFDEMKTERSCA